MTSPIRVLGIICTIAICDYVYPPASVPPSDILSGFSRSISRQLDTALRSVPPIVTLQKYWPSSPAHRTFNIREDTVRLKGYFSRTVRGRPFSAFEGIPYAKPPVGILRFQDPQKQIDWPETFDATKKPPVCIQMDPLRYLNIVVQEDCLYLNVYTHLHADSRMLRLRDKKYPVMVFIHGGGWFHGSGNHYGPAYIMDEDIILVAINYRLGPLGFLSTGDNRIPGNMGLKDQALAINWVYHNIEAFGGDPNRITLFGQSAGAASLHLQMMSTQAKDKIFSAILQSGSAFCHWTFPPLNANHTNKVSANFGCSPQSPDLANCLRKIPAKQLASAQYDLFEWRENPAVLFGPVIEHKHKNAFISDSPESLYKTGQVANIPLVTGVTRDEGDIYSFTTYLGSTTRPLLEKSNERLPIVLMYPKEDIETTLKIKEYYLKGFRNPTLSGYEALGNISQMLGDLFLYSPIDKAMEYHINWTTSPVYGYFFSYHGKHGIVEKQHIPTSQFGVLHSDDVQYLFNSTEYYYPLSPNDKDYAIVEYMTTLWTNFSKSRIPSLQNSRPGNLPIWRKFDLRDRNVLDINEKLSMIRQPYKTRFDFWKSIPLLSDIETK